MALTMQSPLFGRCNLIEQDAETLPDGELVFGYVRHRGSSKILLSVWRDGKWHNRKLQPLQGVIECWYLVEKADGSPLFG
ncbi:hypothetical protein [Pontixanthobacter sp. CEM42]|uniref:hypothetical protein n=1 Tax=Pontixanthobacter sp. CEM42 TaxID=2792077 RepID=UPI001ADFB0A7|nr:hypothetical protein [Pontixanthobacter sp. CEM42]